MMYWVWATPRLCGAWGGVAAGIFGSTALGGAGGVTFMSLLVGTLVGVSIAIAGGFLVYGAVKATMGIRLSEEDEYMGADLAIHQVSSTPKRIWALSLLFWRK